MNRFTKNFITIYGKQFFYWEKYPQQKEVVVCLHGFPGNHMGLIDLANNLGPDRRLLLLDLPACGKSASLENEHTLENYAHWLNQFLDALQIQQAVFIGHSFGSRVMIVFSGLYPDKISKLVFITPVVKLNGLIPRIASLKGYIAKMLPSYMQKHWLSNRLYQYAVRMIVFKSASPKRRQEITNIDLQESKNIDARATIEIFNEFYQIDLTPLCKRILLPTLLIAADRDEVALVDSIEELAGTMPKVSFVVMKNSGHLVPLERPIATARVIKAWLHN